jgi:hypothetical protein
VSPRPLELDEKPTIVERGAVVWIREPIGVFTAPNGWQCKAYAVIKRRKQPPAPATAEATNKR